MVGCDSPKGVQARGVLGTGTSLVILFVKDQGLTEGLGFSRSSGYLGCELRLSSIRPHGFPQTLFEKDPGFG